MHRTLSQLPPLWWQGCFDSSLPGFYSVAAIFDTLSLSAAFSVRFLFGRHSMALTGSLKIFNSNKITGGSLNWSHGVIAHVGD